MTNTTCFRLFLKYTALNVIGMIGLSCYILADTFFVSKGLGADGLAALNLAIPVYSFVHGGGLMIGIGGGTKYSILKSQRRVDDANQSFTHAFMLTLGLAVVFFLTGVFFSGQVATLLGADEAVFEMSRTYLQVILLFAPAFMLNNLLLCFTRNDGAPQLSMAAMLGGSLSNIILDYIFIFPLKMGIFGAVLATGLAPVISMLILLPFLIRRKNGFHLCRCRLYRRVSSGIISSGLPSLITEAASGIVIIVFNRIILGIQGNTGVAAYGVIANLSLVIMAIYTGVAQGVQPIISSSYGAGDYQTVRGILRCAIITLFVISGMIYIGVFFGAEQIAGVFNSENNQLLQSIAVTGLKCYFTACLFAGLNIVVSVYFTSVEYARPAHMISVLRGFIVIIPMALILSSVWGMTGVWCSFPATELIVSVVGVGLFWKDIKRRLASPELNLQAARNQKPIQMGNNNGCGLV